MIAGTGLRRGEAVGLRWDDVDFARRVIVVRQQVVQESGRKKNKQAPVPCPYCAAGHLGMSFGKPKTKSGEDRVVDLDEATVGALLAHRMRQDAEREQWDEAYADHGLVFAREDGNPLRPDDVTKLFGALVDAAGLRRIRLHDLRHGQASLMLASAIRPLRSRWTLTRTCSEASGGMPPSVPRPSCRAPGRRRRPGQQRASVTTW
ncbi:tyrosine-type recombinase/integrase [Streptomyces sp. NPDC056188]|uniref:tyrosine-type recombinase/integrase n=1 Tax=Streptomyces sp. NPDC056188 TaxID=3345740 RepID=UPI0035D9FB02